MSRQEIKEAYSLLFSNDLDTRKLGVNLFMTNLNCDHIVIVPIVNRSITTECLLKERIHWAPDTFSNSEDKLLLRALLECPSKFTEK